MQMCSLNTLYGSFYLKVLKKQSVCLRLFFSVQMNVNQKQRGLSSASKAKQRIKINIVFQWIFLSISLNDSVEFNFNNLLNGVNRIYATQIQNENTVLQFVDS